jgi:hypothetical protein
MLHSALRRAELSVRGLRPNGELGIAHSTGLIGDEFRHIESLNVVVGYTLLRGLPGTKKWPEFLGSGQNDYSVMKLVIHAGRTANP